MYQRPMLHVPRTMWSMLNAYLSVRSGRAHSAGASTMLQRTASGLG